jgi:hypothetical protein
MKKTWLILLTAMTLFAISMVAAPIRADPITKGLLAGSPHHDTPKWNPEQVGTVTVSNDGTYLYITYATWNPWVITETHVAVATSLQGIPQTKSGNPKVGQFPYKHEDLGGVTSDPYTIPLADLSAGSGDTLVIAAHAVVEIPCCREETAWGDCGISFPFPGNNWALYFEYLVQ